MRAGYHNPYEKDILCEITKLFQCGYSKTYITHKLAPKYNMSEENIGVYYKKVKRDARRSIESYGEELAEYIFRVLEKTVDDTITDDDRKARLKALELLNRIFLPQAEQKINVDVNFGFDYGDEQTELGGEEEKD